MEARKKKNEPAPQSAHQASCRGGPPCEKHRAQTQLEMTRAEASASRSSRLRGIIVAHLWHTSSSDDAPGSASTNKYIQETAGCYEKGSLTKTCADEGIDFVRGEGGGVCIEKSIRGGGSELSDQLFDPDVPTLASQVKLKVSPKGLPFVNSLNISLR